MKILNLLTIVTSCVTLASCGYGYRDEPAPVDGSDVVVNAYQPPSQVEIKPTFSSPVQSLLEESHRLQASGDLAGAVASIERALRIEPRNAYLWNRLAHLRLDQGEGKRAEELAAKSTSLAGSDSKLKADNLSLIARARGGSGY